ncbi:MAG: hypothetical protein N3D17_06215 [bacterium]|nr:hypothetical protein [bacterium]
MTLSGKLSAGEGKIYQSVVSIENGVNVKEATVKYYWDKYTNGKFLLNLQIEKEVPSAKFKVVIPEGCIPEEVKINGEKVQWKYISLKVPGTGVMFDVSLKRENEIEVRWQPEICFTGELKDYLNFPFVSEEEKPQTEIILYPDAKGKDEITAKRIQAYFRYFYGMKGWKNDWRGFILQSVSRKKGRIWWSSP